MPDGCADVTRELRIGGVGQNSWYPQVRAVLPTALRCLADLLQNAEQPGDGLPVIVTQQTAVGPKDSQAVVRGQSYSSRAAGPV